MLKETTKEYASLLKENKSIFLVYLIVVSVLFLSMFSPRYSTSFNIEIGSFVLIAISGILLILYGFKNKDSLHKVSFAVVMFVGIILTFIAPPFSLHDEAIHLNRVVNIVDGFIYPITATNGAYQDFLTPLLLHMKDLYGGSNFGIANLFLNNAGAFVPISDVEPSILLGITNTPFYTYIPSAIGVFIAKSLNLGVIYAVWLSRIPNLIVYAIITSYAIKRAPCYKMPMFLVTCTPLATTVMFSSNYDSFLFAVFILAIAEFIYMYKNGALKKNLLIFFICCLLIGLIKPPYLFFTLLVLFLPKEKLNFAYPRLKLAIAAILLCIVAMFLLSLSSLLFNISSLAIGKSHSVMDNIHHLLIHPRVDLRIVRNSMLFIGHRFIWTNYFYHVNWVGKFRGTEIFNLLYFVLFMAFSILYPIKIKFSRKKRWALAIYSLVFYIGLFFILYISWNTPESFNIIHNQPRYYVPLFLLMPFIFNYPFKKIKKVDYWAIMGIVVFVMGILLLTVTHFY